MSNRPQSGGPVTVDLDRPVHRSALVEAINGRLDEAPAAPRIMNRAQRRAAAKGRRK